MTDQEIDARVGAFQQVILSAMIGVEVPVVAAGLTTILGAVIAQQARTPAEARMLCRKVAKGITMIAEDSAGKVGRHDA